MRIAGAGGLTHGFTFFAIIPATGLFRQLSPEGLFSGEWRTRRHILGGIIRGVVKRPKTQSLGGRKRINMRREVANAKALGRVIASPSSAVLTLKRGESATLAALRRALVFSLAHAGQKALRSCVCPQETKRAF